MKDYLWEVVKNTCMIIAGGFYSSTVWYWIGSFSLYCIITTVCSNVSKRLCGI